ncbi:MAG TPA: ion channel [Phnomibacter sp.]|nr:ion channel [Phnomibacter sp.]
MALRSKLNPLLRANNDTGFGTTSAGNTGRFVNRNGSFNVRRRGVAFWNRYSVYNILLSMNATKFILIVFSFFIVTNILFTFIYIAIGIDQFSGFAETEVLKKDAELFFFSAQTFTTVGYGRINPIGFSANLVASIEALAGLLSFAVMTGLLYGRFVRPRANLLFSDFAVVAPYKDITGLMFRFVSIKDKHSLTDVSVRVNVGMNVMENGRPVYKFYDLELERNRIDSLPMNLTVVHPIDEKSPLYNYNAEDMEVADVELYVLVRAYDDVYNSTVQQRTSYIYNEIVHGEKFVPMYHESADGNTTIVDLDKINETIEMKLPALKPV